MRQLLLLALPLVAACGLDEFNVSQSLPEQVVQGSPLPGVLDSLFPVPIALDIKSEVESHETGPIDDITLADLFLDITATSETGSDADDWSFVERIELYIDPTQQGSSLDAHVLIAVVENPGAVRRLEFTPVEGVDLKGYVDEGAQVTAESQGTAPADDVSFDGDAVFTVDPL